MATATTLAACWRADEARRAAHHKHGAARELVHGRRRRHHDVEIVLEVDAPGNRVGVNRQLLGLLGEGGHHDGPAHVTSHVGEEAGLEREHGHDDVAAIRTRLDQIAANDSYVLKTHGLYVDTSAKTALLDIVVSFDAPDREAVGAHVTQALEAAFPAYRFTTTLDADTSD